ncbi:DUF962 domain-containing protein [Nostoc sp. 3335mG]|nr:DUF962 domain-containing protein [Nostoc sp. 3335mG]
MASRGSSFDAYWLSYLRAHRHPVNRLLHVVGTSVGLIGGLCLALFVKWWLIFPVGGAGYALALVGHGVFERNRPFAYRPHLGFLADLRMVGLTLSGRIGGELRRAGIA